MQRLAWSSDLARLLFLRGKSVKRNIYIDGENLVHIILNCLVERKVIGSRNELSHFDLRSLMNFVTRVRPAKPKHVRYYSAKLGVVTTSPALTKLSQDMIKWNAKWVNILDRQGIEVIKCGRLKIRDAHKCRSCGGVDQIFVEKGVDVGMAVDVVSDALKDSVDEVVLFSGDSDMLPAIKRAHGVGVKVIYAAYSGAVNRALTTMVDEVWTYSADQIVAAFRGKK
jgi:uncharacterized LabA/DUF88 family protein